MPNKIEVTYNTERHSACMGRLIVKQNDREIFNKEYCCESTGRVEHCGNGQYNVFEGVLVLRSEYAEMLSDEINEKICEELSKTRVCCGGCT